MEAIAIFGTFYIIIAYIMALFFSAIYFLPIIIALVYKSSNTVAVVILNLLLGWTLIFWIVALCMAFGKAGTQQVVIQNKNDGFNNKMKNTKNAWYDDDDND